MKILSSLRRRTLVKHLREEAGQLTFIAAELSSQGFQSSSERLLHSAEEISDIADVIDPDKE